MKEKRKLSAAEEAIEHEKNVARRSGQEPGLSPKEAKEKYKTRFEDQAARDKNTEDSHLEKFTAFNNDPMSYLHSLVSQGDFAGRDQRSQLYSLITMIKIEQSLKDLISVLKARK